MNIVLVGASGYLGNKLLKRLISQNNNVLCLIRKNTNIKLIKGITKNYIHIEDDNFSNNINNFNPEVLIYCSSIYQREYTDYNDILNVNFIYPFNLINKIKVKTYIYIGTALDKFTNIYSLTKYQLAEFGKYYFIQNDINFYNIILENFYGEDEPKDRFVSYVINKLKNNEELNLTAGSQKRDFIYIEDVIDGLILIINSNLKGYVDIPLGSGECISIKEFILYTKDLLNSTSKLNFGALSLRKNEHSGYADLSIMNKIGFQPKYNLKNGIKKLLQEKGD